MSFFLWKVNWSCTDEGRLRKRLSSKRFGRRSLSAAEGGGQKTYLLVMENFFHTPVEIHKRYDLKGSTFGRDLPLELRKWDCGDLLLLIFSN